MICSTSHYTHVGLIVSRSQSVFYWSDQEQPKLSSHLTEAFSSSGCQSLFVVVVIVVVVVFVVVVFVVVAEMPPGPSRESSHFAD